MSSGASLKIAAPSKSLLRYLRSQSDILYHLESKTCDPARRRHAVATNAHLVNQRRLLSSTLTRTSRTPRSYIDELWPRHREQKALPPPRHQYHQQPYHAQQFTQHVHPNPQPPFNSWRRNFWRRLRGSSDRHERPDSDESSNTNPLNNQQYEDTSAQLFNLSRALSRNPSGSDLKLRCTEFDAQGNVTLVSGEFKKSELIAKYGLLPRDLRKIDSSILPHVLVRPSAILVNLLHLRVLIQADRVLVFDAFGSTDSYTQSLFMYDLEGKLRQKSDKTSPNYLPYELRALEAVLISATSGLEAEFTLVRDPVVRVLRALESDIDRDKLRHLLVHSKKLGTFEQKARLVRDAINDILEADDDLAAMYLTERKSTGKPRSETDHQEVEMLLESYHKICDEIVEISGNLISNIRNTEEVTRAILDSNRNELMLLDLKVGIGTLGLAGGTLVAGLYGMNLENFIETSHFAFGGVSTVCFGLAAVICMYGMRKVRKVQKVRMWGEGSLSFRAIERNWRNEALEGGAAMAWRGKDNAAAAAAKEQKQQWKMQQKYGMGGGAAPSNGGPVLWPGMEGLGMHKLRTDVAADSGEQVDSERTSVNSSSASTSASSSASNSASKSAPKSASPPTLPPVPVPSADTPTVVAQAAVIAKLAQAAEEAPSVTVKDDLVMGREGERRKWEELRAKRLQEEQRQQRSRGR